MVKLHTLAPGTRFRYPVSDRTAVLVSVGECGARVLYDGAKRRVDFTPAMGEDVSFEAPGKPVIVSANSDVERIA